MHCITIHTFLLKKDLYGDFANRSTPQDDSETLICLDYRLLLRNPDNDRKKARPIMTEKSSNHDNDEKNTTTRKDE
ncbi:MAG: hypothetical protein IJ564_06050 [Alphaproteobacteria bacterium]|nr:hypothetical protein [Alphaproteobacteria bacterium]